LAAKGRRARLSRDSLGATESLRVQPVDSTIVICKVLQPKKQRHDESKGLTRDASGERRSTFSGLVGPPQRGEGNPLIPQWVMANSLRRTGEGLLNLEDLLTVFPPSGGAIFSRFVGRPKRDVGNLLIPQWLMAHLVRRTGEGLLNLKGLLTVFPPRLKRLFESGPVFEASLSRRIAPNSATLCQNVAEYARKSRVFATDFVLNVVWQLVFKLWPADRLAPPERGPERGQERSGKRGSCASRGEYQAGACWMDGCRRQEKSWPL